MGRASVSLLSELKATCEARMRVQSKQYRQHDVRKYSFVDKYVGTHSPYPNGH